MDLFLKLLDLDEAIRNENFSLVKEYINILNTQKEDLEKLQKEFLSIFLTYLNPGTINSEKKLEIINYLINNFVLIKEEEKNYFILLCTYKFLANNEVNLITLKNWLKENGKNLLILNKQSNFNNELSKNLQIEILLTCRVKEFYDLMKEFREVI